MLTKVAAAWLVVALIAFAHRLHARSFQSLPADDRDVLQELLRWQWLAAVGFGACLLAIGLQSSNTLDLPGGRHAPVLIGMTSSSFLYFLRRHAYRIYMLAADDADTARVDRAVAMLSVTGRAFALSALAWLLVAVYRA